VEQPKKLRELALLNPERTRAFLNRGAGIAHATNISIGIGLNTAFGWPCGGVGFGTWDDNCWWNGNGCNQLWWNSWCCGGFSWSWCCHPCSFWYWNWYGCWPYGISYWYPYSYIYSPPVYYASTIYEYTDPAYSSSTAEAPPAYPAESEPAAVGEGVIRQGKENPELEALLAPRTADSLERASSHYLALGDSAFRDGRYGDAVHFYAKAVEFAPDQGVLYLVLSDALFSTGDYHYGAYALRRGLELDPTLLDKTIDKHSFYADPLEFERQLALLETYLKDRPTDHDARLLLAANYVFGNRPAASVDLLESAAGTAVRESPAGKLVLASAQRLQFGTKKD
jgi:tetratricopeptide (TPR) repeat protein